MMMLMESQVKFRSQKNVSRASVQNSVAALKQLETSVKTL